MDFGIFGKISGPNERPAPALKFGNFSQPHFPPPPPVARTPRPSTSPPKKRSDSHFSPHGPLSSTSEHYNKEEVSERPMSFPAAKKPKLRSLSPSDQVFQEESITGQDEINRIWKQRSSKKRELREHKRLAANAALASLSLGLPIRQPATQSSTFGVLDLDWFMSKRSAIQEKMWSRLNVSEVVASTLAERNQDAKCFCWKILLFSEEDGCDNDHLGKKREVTHLAASSWLRSKLVPTSAEDDHAGDLAFSSLGLSIWKKWYPSQTSDELTCYLTVVRKANLENLNEVAAGSSAVLFPVSESIPWQLQRNRLQSILTSLTFGSRLPLLILSDSCNDNLDASTIINELGLLDIDRSRISTYLVVFLKNQKMGNLNVFFSDEQLREGFQWLANELPKQPVLSRMKTRELVLFHLNSSLKVLSHEDAHKVGPNDCISTFNQTLDQSLVKVTTAVSSNPTSWPCPEITLLQEFSDEYRAVLQYLPDPGWSSATRIEPLICALNSCRLPSFEEDISWLYNGADGSNDIETHRLKLQNCLIKYLTQSSQMMVLPFSTKEASLMLQKFVQLELHNLTYYIVPRWVMIFRRVFHWRLMDLSNVAFSSAYILSHDYASILASGVLDKTDVSMPLSSSLAYPSLDEIVAVSCTSPILRVQKDCEASYPHSSSSVTPKTVNEVKIGEDVENVEGVLVLKDGCTATEVKNGNESASATKAIMEPDKLSQLLAKCNIIQNTIQEKLSFYF